MAVTTKQCRPLDYTVAWICALPLEMAAAEAMLDETHHNLQTTPSDTNSYTLGRIHAHNVVITCLPSGIYGTTSATMVAAQMSSTFQSIRFFLMVGIGGGAPSAKDDIRLGDVVVSKPTRDLGAVIQYDYGKAMSGGRFQRTGVLNKPPSVLLTAISTLQAAHMLRPNKISSLVSEIVAMDPSMGKFFAYPGESQDLLFDHKYDHPASEDTCSRCDKRRLVKRSSRAGSGPLVHYGLIASGNQVVKDSRIRDKLVQELGVICFEMEAAGLMDNFPCLVIRGICDYSDSHKNKQWQNYAAATAAAYAKELLSVVHANQDVDTPPADWGVSHHKDNVLYRGEHSTSVILREGLGDKLMKKISDYDHERIHRRLSQKRLIGTTQWFLDHPDFQAWFAEKSISSLWCSGKIGSGKTMIATAVVEAAKYRSSEGKSPTLFFYCDHEHHGVLDEAYIISSFIKQFCEFLHQTSSQYPKDIAQSLKIFFGPDRTQPDFNDLQDIFVRLFHAVPDTIYIIDGIDALHKEHAKRLLSFIRTLFCSSNLPQGSRILLLSRDQVPGYININTFIQGIHRISTSTNITQDIKIYIESSITEKTMYRKLTNDSAILGEMKRILLNESSDMFLWVYLQLEIIWDTCYTDAEIRSTLAALPKDLKETYGRCVDRINLQDARALKVLKWVSFANGPLHIEELIEAVAFDSIDTAWNIEKKPQKSFVMGCCANLVVLDLVDNCVRFAHSSVRQYLDDKRTNSVQEEFIRGYPTTEQGDLECGEFCVAYLSFSDFGLQLSRTVETAVAAPSPISLAQEAYRAGFASGLVKLFLRPPQTPKSPIVLPFRTIRTNSDPNRTKYKFLDYAIANWAVQTKQITRTSPMWEKFKQLATNFNETWNFHPWVSGGRSRDSRIHGLFGWAVKEQHEPLLSIARDAGSSLLRVCDLPLVGESLPALHLASKLGYKRIVEILLDFCDVNQTDQDRCTALHHAASKGHLEVCQLLSRKNKVKVDVESEYQCTPLWLAASNGHEEVVLLLIEKQANLEANDTALRQTPLSRAVENEHHAIVRLLLEKGAQIETRDANGQTPLMGAIKKLNRVMIEQLLEQGARADYEEIDSWSLLLWATMNGHERVVKLLIEKSADYDLQDLLLLATKNAHTAIVRLLLQKGAEPDAYSSERKPLVLAVENGYTDIVELLLQSGASYNVHSLLTWAARNGHETVMQLLLQKDSTYNCKELLPLAIENGHDAVIDILLAKYATLNNQDLLSWAIETDYIIILELFSDIVSCIDSQESLSWAVKQKCAITMKLLLETGANLNAKDTQVLTVLHWAAMLEYEEVVNLLLKSGTDPKIMKNINSQTPLSWAAGNGQEAMVKLLLENSADVNAISKNGQTALSWAASKGQGAMVQLLLENGADINAQDHRTRTALHYAADNGHETATELLLESGANPNAEDHCKETPLYYAAKKGQRSVIKILLGKGANPNIRGCYFPTPLHWAAKRGDEEVVQLLLQNGANPNAEALAKQTPLHLAARNGQEGVVRLLLDNGAVPDIVAHNGDSPLSLAATFGHDAVVRILRGSMFLKEGYFLSNLNPSSR
ncbi:putative ankyrin repeat-containing protein [Trichoderma ceciliae]